jgi:hypothetical protein
MNGSPEPLLECARACVRRAVEEANPASVDGLEVCQRLLGEAAAHVSEVQGCLTDLPSSQREELRQSLATFRQEVDSATRLMDSGAAFFRVMAGVSSANYDSTGQPDDEKLVVDGLQA